MAYKAKPKVTRQEKRRIELDQVLKKPATGQIRDFYDYMKEAVRVIDQNVAEDRIFSRWLKLKFRQANGLQENMKATFSVQDYIDWGAEKLASEMEQLERWHVDSLWTWDLPETHYVDVWKRILTLWWEKDSFPELSYKSVKCTNRDIVIYVLMVLGFSVDEADQFLDEFCRVKRGNYLRRLYALDYKEGLFRWIMSWNENHPEKQISYERACLLYEEYGGELLRGVKSDLDNLCANIVRECEYWNAEIKTAQSPYIRYKKQVLRVLSELKELRKDCLVVRENLCDTREDLYREMHAENLKRALTISVYGRRTLERKKDELRRREFTFELSEEEKFRMIRKWTDETIVNRGTEFAWLQMMKYAMASCSDFTESFEAFKKGTVSFLSDAYWRQFSQMMKLYGMSGGFYEEHKRFVYKKTFSAKTNAPQLYKKTVLISKKDSQSLSFALGSKEVKDAVQGGTANGMYLSELVRPVWRNSEDVFSYTKGKSVSRLSGLWSQYEKWCKGKKGPYEAYTRDTILELALASNMESMSEIQDVMSLAGSREWNLQDPREALVYLVVRYRDELKKVIRDINDLMETVQTQGLQTAAGEKNWIELQSRAATLPALYIENLPDYMCKIGEMPENDQDRQGFIQEVAEIWQSVIREEIPIPTVIEYLHMADRLGILFRASFVNTNKIREKMFYGPYTTDFASQKEDGKKGVAGELAWLEIQNAWSILMNGLLKDTAVKKVFEFWYQNMQSGLRSGNFLGVFIDDWEDTLDLVKRRIKRVKDQLEILMEVEYTKNWKTEIRVKCENIEEALEAFHQTITSAGFMKQDPNAAETKYILEQWITLLAMMELLEVSTEGSVLLLEEYVHHWIITGGLNYFDYTVYKKKAGLENTEQSAVTIDQMVNLEEKYTFWAEIYQDYRTLCASIRWFEEFRPEQSVVYRKKLNDLKAMMLEEVELDSINLDEEEEKKSSEQRRFKNMKKDWDEVLDYGEDLVKTMKREGLAEYEKNDKWYRELEQWHRWFYNDLEVNE